MARGQERVTMGGVFRGAGWRGWRRTLAPPGELTALLVLGMLGSFASPEAQALPAGFQESVVFSGLTQPTALAFAPDGRVFVAEKSGLLKVFASLAATTPTVFADLRTQVHNFWDRGLLGLALHPGFPATPYVYVLYTHDAAIGGTAPRWGTPGATTDPCPTPPGPTADGCVVSGRLSRLTAAGSVMSGPEQVLIEAWCQQYPGHSVGALAFGTDGALYVTGGEGASFNFVDYGQDGAPLNPCGDPPAGVGGTQSPPTAEGGALRSQSLRRAPGGPVLLNGTLLRVDPLTGQGLPDNPLATSPDSNARRIVAHGFRTPFRFTPRPGTSEIWVGDVGWMNWEEIDRIPAPTAGVLNFGWPCYEGPARQPGYDSAGLNICETLYGQPGAVTAPFYAYSQATTVVPGDPCPAGGTSLAGLAFYPGGNYPPAYDGALFFADYVRRCIWVMFAPTGPPDPSTVATFLPAAAAPVDLKTGPGGDLFYVDFDGGTVRRVRFFGANTPPTAVIQATPTSGPSPLTVSFDGRSSIDPDPGDTIAAYAWDLDGDGQYDDATTAQTSATYSAAGPYTVRLRVTDQAGATGLSSVVITVGNASPTATIDAPLASATWQVGDTILFSGRGTDPQEGALPPSRLSWAVVLHHCATPTSCHTHPLLNFVGVAEGSFVAPDHSYPSHLEFRLTATDSGGLTHTHSRLLQPRTTALTLQSSPAGLQLALNGTGAPTPFTHTVIVGSQNSVSAPSPQTQGTNQYTWVAWSDGGAQTHLVTAGPSGGTYTATYVTPTGTGTATLTVTLAGEGSGGVTSAPSGISCPPDCQEPLATGVIVTLTAAPAPGSVLSGWSGCDVVAGLACTVTLKASHGVTATFGPALPVLTVQLNGVSFSSLQTLVLTATLTPGTTPMLVDAYVVLRLPDGGFLSLTEGGLVSEIVPIARNISPFAFAGEMLRHTFTGLEPVGSYLWLAALTAPRTLDAIGGLLDQHPFTFTP